MKYLLLSLLLLLPLSANAARQGPIDFQMLPNCATGTGSIINYNSTTGVFSCNTVTGQTLTWTAPQTFGVIAGYYASISTQSGTSYTLLASDCGTKILFSNSSAVTVTVPKTLAVGCEIALQQNAAGKVSVTPISGATINSPHSYTSTFALGSVIVLTVDTNVGGASGVWSFAGDGS